MERALVGSLRWLVAGLILSPVLLLAPNPESGTILVRVIVHLMLLVVLGLATTYGLREFADMRWFEQFEVSEGRAWFGAAVTLVALVTGVVALVTLASSAALRYDRSLQFLQLLSAIDIAWSVAGVYFGIRRLFGEAAARITSGMVAAICVWSIWNYLEIAGFTPEPGWLVDGPTMIRHVIPYDVAAAVLAIGSLVAASRHSTAQRKPQS